MKRSLLNGLIGVIFGFALSNIGFTSWDEVHHMFTFANLRLLFAFCLAVGVLLVSWKLITKTTGASWSPRSIHKGTVIGGVLFGTGWALSGACPSIALVQLGEAQLGALVTLAGMFLGNYVYSVVHQRYFRWPIGSCSED